MIQAALKRRRRWLALAGLAALALPLWIALRAYLAERRTFATSSHPPHLGVRDFGIEGLGDVSFASRDGSQIRGVFAPARRGAAILLVHGSGGDRCDVASEARILAGAGFGVLAIDLPGQGQSEGRVQWGESERQALAGALDFAARQPGVRPDRLGAYGFSLGGYVLVQAATLDSRIAAVAVAGTTGSYADHTFWEYRKYGLLSEWPALLAKRTSGMKLDELEPRAVIERIAPRPLLLIAGSKDELVPSWMTESLFSKAREPKTLLIVPGASHGNYAKADPSGYAAALLKFFGFLLE